MNFIFKNKGSFDNTRNYLQKAEKIIDFDRFNQIAKDAVDKLAVASPNEDIAKGWNYEIEERKNKIILYFTNDQVENGVNVAVIIDTGHATKDGQWIAGTNYLKQPVEEIYKEIFEDTWEELKKL